ncbi:MAG: carbohydrate kinase family protein [Candidatus Heimdallarchaeota archaeon]
MILTIGNINVDIICSVPHLPKPDDKVIVSNLSIVPGGGACNFAVGLARLGSDVSLFDHVGNDHNGKKGIESLILENVDTTNVVVEVDVPTGFVIILVDKNGQSIKIGYREANELLSLKEITTNLLNNVKIVHVSSVNAEIALKVVKLCKKLNIISSIDLGGEMMSLSSEQILQAIADYSIVFMNQLGFQRAFNAPEINKVVLKKAMNKMLIFLI